MSRFVLKNIESVKGRQQFKQLVIVDSNVDTDSLQAEIDKIDHLSNEEKLIGEEKVITGVMDLYENSLEKKYRSSYAGILVYMNLVADLQTVPSAKFKYITPHNESIKEFEFKKGDLRIYGIDVIGGKIIILCGYKNQQKQDISKFRLLKDRFLDSCTAKKIENEKRRIN